MAATAKTLVKLHPDYFLSDTFTHMNRPEYIPLVRNQFHLNTCWAHVSSDAVQIKMGLEYRIDRDDLSVQELIEFVPIYYRTDSMKLDQHGQVVFKFTGYGNDFINAFKYVKEYGLAFNKHYPLVDRVIRPRFSSDRPVGKKVFIQGYKTLLVHQIAWTLPTSPIAISVIAYESFLKWHSEDIYMGPTPADLVAAQIKRPDRHALLVVGHGISNDVQYFTAKNSWGETWGFNGYVKLARPMICKDTGGSYPYGITVDYCRLDRI